MNEGSTTVVDHPTVDRVLDDLQVRVLVNRIIDPERSRPILVVTTGTRAPADQLNPNRIAAGVGDEVEVAVVGTGRLTYTLRDGLPDETDVFGDAARTYPTGTAWHARPELAPLRYARPDTDLHRLEQQVIADARSALRASTRPAPVVAQPTRKPAAPTLRVEATPGTLPGAPDPRPTPAPPTPAQAAPTPLPGATTAATPPAVARLSGPTPARPYGTPPPAAARPAPEKRHTAAAPRVSSAAPQGNARLPHDQPWQAQTEADGHALARHLLSDQRSHPVLVISTPSHGAAPLLDADDLHHRVGSISDVVVLHNGPASWALAEGVPPRTEVYGGAGRVYPTNRGWWIDPYQAPLRFCWPADVPARVADTLEDDAYAAATLDGSLTQTTTPETATRPATGKVDGFLDRHNALLRLSDSTQAFVVVDELVPGIVPERLLQPGMHLAGRVIIGGLVGRFLPDPIANDPAAQIDKAYRPGDLALARISHIGPHTATGLLHPQVEVSVTADEVDLDLRSLLEAGDVVTLELTAADPWQATLAHTDTPSVVTPPILPGGPAWLTEDDLPQPTPVEEPEPANRSQPETRTTPAPEGLTGLTPVTEAGDTSLRPTPGGTAPHSQLLGLQAQIDDLASRLQSTQADVDGQRRAARTAREEAKKLRNQLRSQKDQMQAYRDRIEGTGLFDDPAEQLRHDVYMAWLRRTPPGEREQWPLRTWSVGPRFLDSVEALEGISHTKVVDVLVEVITGRDKGLSGRDLHQLLEGKAGAPRVRHDGALAWRCALQINAAGARRLHYWTLPDKSIELDQVGVHDDAIVA